MREFVTALLVCAIFYLTFAVVFHPYNDGGIGQWFYNYQTLIGGILALGAAVFTVQKMADTDSKQLQMHRAMIEEGRRLEYIRIVAAADYYAVQLKQLAVHLDLLEKAFNPANHTGRISIEYALGRTLDLTGQIEAMVNELKLGHARDYFEPKLFNAWLQLEEMVLAIPSAGPSWDFHQLRHRLCTIAQQVRQIADLMECQAAPLRERLQ